MLPALREFMLDWESKALRSVHVDSLFLLVFTDIYQLIIEVTSRQAFHQLKM